MLSPRFHFFFQPFRPGIHGVDDGLAAEQVVAKHPTPVESEAVLDRGKIVAFFKGRAEGRTGRMAVVASNGTRHLRISL
jgi:hypothetical protein